jgi:ribosomal 50S subunit-recycling heat shock protein
MAANTYTAVRRLYLDKDGKVVEADNPARASLLVNAGGTLSLEDATRYGLVTVTQTVEPVAPAEEKAQTEPRPNKAKAPSENK